MGIINTQAAAKRLGISAITLRLYIRQGRIKAVRLGRDYVIEEADLAPLLVRPRAGRPRKGKGSDETPGG
jgi:excisionase family DNA binding protein